MRHAGAGGENAAWNTRDFELDTSADGQSWTRAVTVTGNTANVTTHPIVPLTVALRAPTRHDRRRPRPTVPAARVYELEIFGTGL